MAIDYFEHLSQTNEDLKTVESATVHYLHLACQDDKKMKQEAEKLRIRWAKANLHLET
ncbi:MAG: hypothetical protein GY765_06400 [bacterium]|nr:hypothetical protein [bacterium]